MARVGLLALVLVALGACTDDEDRIAFDGQYFRAKAAKVDNDRAQFRVTIKGAEKSYKGARAAAYYEGVSYCIRNYGSSRIKWSIGPETPASAVPIQNGNLIYSGTCPQGRDVL